MFNRRVRFLIDENSVFLEYSQNVACSDKYVAPGLMKASAKSPVIRAALELAFGDPSTYNSNIFNAVGPKAITMAIKKYPDSIHILDQHVFYPFVYSDAHILMKNTNDPQALVQRLRRKSTSLHLYGHQTRMLNEEPKSIIQAVYDTFSITDPATYQLHVPINYLPTPFESTVIPDVHIRFPIDPQQFAETNFTVTIAAQHGSVRLIPDKTYHQQIKISGTSKNIHRINAKLSQMIYQMNNAQERDTITINLESELSPTQTHHIQVYNVAKLATLIVKTFGRMDKVFALVRTVRHYYPGLRILVADDGESIAKTAGKYRGFEYLPLPYDVGLSAGRNCLLEKVDTPYFMTLDDDFLLDEQSVIEGLIHALEVGNFDIAAGKNPVDESKFDIDFCGTMTVDATAMWLQPGFRGEPRAECHPVDFVPNLFAARTQVIREKLLWDENLKLGEHEDFFWRAKQLGIRVATCPAVSFIHDQVPHWLQRTKYEKLRSRVYDFWKVSLKKHGLSRLVSFGTVVMDLVEPPPLRCLYSTEIMSQSFSLEWYGCSDAVQFKVVHQLGTDSYTTVNAGEGESWRERRITIRLVQPNTDYTIVVFASNGFVNEKIGRKIIVRTLPDNFLDGELLKNGGFESGHFDWYSSFGVPHHIVRPGHSSNFAARMHITTRGYNSFHPTPSKLYQIVDMSKVTKPFHRLQIVGWSRVERFYGMTSNWRLGAIVEFKDRLQTYSYYEEFDHALLDWQVRSFTICLRDGSLVDRVTIYGELVAHRGSVFFDNFSVKVF